MGDHEQEYRKQQDIKYWPFSLLKGTSGTTSRSSSKKITIPDSLAREYGELLWKKENLGENNKEALRDLKQAISEASGANFTEDGLYRWAFDNGFIKPPKEELPPSEMLYPNNGKTKNP